MAEQEMTRLLTEENPKTPTSEEDVKHDEIESATSAEPLSKRALKKRLAHEKMLLGRKEKRKQEKERRKKRRREALESESSEALENRFRRIKPKPLSLSKCKQRVSIDMSFDDLMNDRDVAKTLKQIQWSYAANKKVENPLQFHIVGFRGKSREIFNKTQGCSNWQVVVSEKPVDEVFAKNEIVYLTSESENVLESLDDSKVYIIGGLVDHNHHKGHCFNLAEEKGWAHARLPIKEHVKMDSRTVLTINHVFEILLHYTECGDWSKVLMDIIPKRKGLATVEKSETETITTEKEKAGDLEVGSSG